MKLILVRHGETAQNANGVIQGQLDGELSERGYIQAGAAGNFISANGEEPRKKAGIIFTSDSGRAANTANAIRNYMPFTEVIASSALREFSYGDYEGKPRESIAWDQLPGSAWTRKVEGGESWLDVRRRVFPYLKTIIHAYAEIAPLPEIVSAPYPIKPMPDINAIIVTHGGPMKLIRTALLGQQAAEPPYDFTVTNGEVWDIDLEVTPGSNYEDRTVRVASFVAHVLDEATLKYGSEKLL